VSKNIELCNLLNEVLGDGILNNNQKQSIHYCPFCHHYKRKLSVNLDKGLWKCWVCGIAGRSYYSLFKKAKASKSQISRLSNILPEKYIRNVDNNINKNIIQLPDQFIPLVVKSNSLERKRALIYLKSRGIKALEILRYNIGYCESGRYSNRIIIPSYDDVGNLNYFISRSYFSSVNLKYINPKVNRDDIIIFDLFINWNYPIVLTEGIFDAITIDINVIPLLGKFLSEKLLKKIIENRSEIFICLDEDAKLDAMKIYEKLDSLGIITHIVNLPKNKDPNILGYDKVWKYINKSKESKDVFKDKIKGLFNW
jgi:DNA primase